MNNYFFVSLQPRGLSFKMTKHHFFSFSGIFAHNLNIGSIKAARFHDFSLTNDSFTMASWTCELSGEPLNTATDEIVVTPSGHVCLKKLLLTKLSENGGMDPFGNGAAPLSEQDVIVLHYKNKIIPPRPSVTSMPALLGLVGKEYEALVLELFDTRKALEETRKELSHALYQNDAAVRVVARLAQERDAARQELMTYKANIPPEEETDKEPPTKRAKTTSPSSFVEPTPNGIPPQDLESMTETWQSLAKERKDKKKSLEVVPPETLKELVELDKKNWHKTRNKAGIVDMKFSEKEIVTAGRDKQLIVYSLTSQTLVHTITIGVVATCVDVHASRVVAGLPDGTIAQYVNGAAVGSPLSVGANAVDIALHPTGKHVVAIVENGTVAFCGITDTGLNSIYTFQATPETEYASGALHPDGLICAAGTTTGAVHLWDFKNQTLADTYEVRACVF